MEFSVNQIRCMRSYTHVRAGTKAAENYMDRAATFQGYTLNDCYGRYSYNKEKAYEYCFDKYAEIPNSSNFHICSHNTNFFSVSWDGDYYDSETDEYISGATFIETPYKSIVIY